MKIIRFFLLLPFCLLFSISLSAQYSGEPVVDIDGNSYKTIHFGNQLWMAENLRVTHYADGREIPKIEKRKDWKSLSSNSAAMCWLNNDEVANRTLYGALYTWSAAVDGGAGSNNNPSGIKGVCPDGWHLPGDAEWKELELFIGMSLTAADDVRYRGVDEGSKLAGNKALWAGGKLRDDSDFGTSGFDGLPGSFRYDAGNFFSSGYGGYWWSATEFNPNFAWYRGLSYGYSSIYRYTIEKQYGFSVRCIKDE